MEALKILVLMGLALFFLDQVGLWLERRDYLYWRHKKPKNSGSGNALLEMNAIFNPGAKHTLEISHKEDAKERDDQGDDKKDPDLKFL